MVDPTVHLQPWSARLGMLHSCRLRQFGSVSSRGHCNARPASLDSTPARSVPPGRELREDSVMPLMRTYTEERTRTWNCSRRQWLRETGLATLGLTLAGPRAFADETPGPRALPPTPAGPRKKVAAVVTAYFFKSHAYHIVGRFLWGYQWQGDHHQPGFEVSSVYTDQVPANDLSRPLALRFRFRISPTVADALTLGTDSLAVDAVLLVGEHGRYPRNAKGQVLYPRYELFEQICDVFDRSKRSAPVYNDKHLSYDRAKARKMVEHARELGFPLMAGSSLPVTWRRPELELPLGTGIEQALVASRGELEIYGIHSLEALQCMVERRKGGE